MSAIDAERVVSSGNAALSVVRSRSVLLPRELSEEELALFARVGRRRELKPGEVIFSRGELGRAMFIVESGEIQLEFGDGMPDKLIGTREFFGELALFIGNHARVANAVAVSPSALVVVEHPAFDDLIVTEPRLLAQFMRRSFSYLVASEQQLIQNLKRRNEDLMVTLDSLRQTQTQLSTAQRLVQTDELTGLCNRRGLYMFLEHLEEQVVLGPEVVQHARVGDAHLVGDVGQRAVGGPLGAEHVGSRADDVLALALGLRAGRGFARGSHPGSSFVRRCCGRAYHPVTSR